MCVKLEHNYIVFNRVMHQWKMPCYRETRITDKKESQGIHVRLTVTLLHDSLIKTGRAGSATVKNRKKKTYSHTTSNDKTVKLIWR